MAETSNEKIFRTALHGFNREDVVAYIENQTVETDRMRRKYEDQAARLQAELDEATAALAEARNRPDLQDALNEALSELEGCRAERDAAQQALEALRAEQVMLTAKNHALEAELSQLREQQATPASAPLSAPIPPVAQVLPEQSAQRDYSELELAAYRRAEVTERLARERAADVYRQIRSVFAGAASRFDTGKNDLDQMTKTLQLDVNQLLQLLSTIRSAYSEAEQSFQAVSEKNRELVDSEL